MPWFLDLRLVLLTAGTLLSFFWIVVILGHRRQRNLERVFFFLCLALTFFFGSSLLALNAELFYSAPPAGLLRFAWTFVCLGLLLIPPLIMHLHLEYAALGGLIVPRDKRIWLAFAWIPSIPILLNTRPPFAVPGDFNDPARWLGLGFQLYLILSMAVAVFWQHRFLKASSDREQVRFHRVMQVLLFLIGVLYAQVVVSQRLPLPFAFRQASAVLLVLAVLPLGLLIGIVQRFNFLQIGRQRNLLFAVFAVFLALLYLTFVRRVSGWLEPYFPPEASAALLLFLPVVFFEPLQRMTRRLLQATAQKELDTIYPLAMAIHTEASNGDLRGLVSYIEQQVKDRFQLERARISILEPQTGVAADTGADHHGEQRFSVYRPGRLNAVLAVRPFGSMISGETMGALRLLSESIASAIDMCIVLEQKLHLERELAQRERMALVGQMAASISHNLKNPLGSIKTILQVQLESSELPPALRGETQLVLHEVNRLSAKLNQLLQFSRPGLPSSSQREHCEITAVAAGVVDVLSREAEARGISFVSTPHPGTCEVPCSAEAANDILSNLVLNAMEASSAGGRVSLAFQCAHGACTLAVEDDGPGIAPELRDKILQPFFTTKSRGTGLGLAIVVRRLEECGGRLEIESPLRDSRGARFQITFPKVQNPPAAEGHR